MDDPVRQAAQRLRWSTLGLLMHTPASDPAKTHVESMVNLSEELMEYGWEDRDVRNFRSLLISALALTSNPPTINALLTANTALVVWKTVAEGN